jgi:transposase
MTPSIFVGIDISKLTLDIAVMRESELIFTKKIENSEASIKGFLNSMRTEFHCRPGDTIYCAEHMGIYARFLKDVFPMKKVRICFESPLQIRLSLGIQRGKSDALDAARIADYARKNFEKLKVWTRPRPCIERLITLRAIRRQLLKMRTMIVNVKIADTHFLREAANKKIGKYTAASFKAIKSDIQIIEKEMAGIIHRDDRLRGLVDLITSVPHVGPVIAMEIIILTNEFRDISCPKKFCSFCGIAPFAKSSGTSLYRKPKISSIGNKEMKKMLHLAALGSARPGDSLFKAYYRRKVQEGKNKMSVLNAVRNKIVRVIFACVRDRKPFEELI